MVYALNLVTGMAGGRDCSREPHLLEGEARLLVLPEGLPGAAPLRPRRTSAMTRVSASPPHPPCGRGAFSVYTQAALRCTRGGAHTLRSRSAVVATDVPLLGPVQGPAQALQPAPGGAGGAWSPLCTRARPAHVGRVRCWTARRLPAKAAPLRSREEPGVCMRIASPAHSDVPVHPV